MFCWKENDHSSSISEVIESERSVYLNLLGLFDNTLTANYEYFRSILENLHLPIKIKLYEKPSMFCVIFFLFLECTLNLPCSVEKRTLRGQVFLKLLSPKDLLI